MTTIWKRIAVVGGLVGALSGCQSSSENKIPLLSDSKSCGFSDDPKRGNFWISGRTNEDSLWNFKFESATEERMYDLCNYQVDLNKLRGNNDYSKLSIWDNSCDKIPNMISVEYRSGKCVITAEKKVACSFELDKRPVMTVESSPEQAIWKFAETRLNEIYEECGVDEKIKLVKLEKEKYKDDPLIEALERYESRRP